MLSRNRKTQTQTTITTADDIPLAHPDMSSSKLKTLFQRADERQAQLNSARGISIPIPSPDEANNNNDLHSDDPPSETERFLDSLLVTLTLSALHTTLDCLVNNQYRQTIVWTEIAWRTITLFPVLLLLVATTNTSFATTKRYAAVRQGLFTTMAIAAGCYLLHIGNKYDYYHVMKRAPPVGTVWVWSVYELGLGFAVASLAVNAVYAWWNGHSFF